MKKHSCVEDIQRIKYYLSFMYHTNRIAYMFLYFSKESLQLYAYSYIHVHVRYVCMYVCYMYSKNCFIIIINIFASFTCSAKMYTWTLLSPTMLVPIVLGQHHFLCSTNLYLDKTRCLLHLDHQIHTCNNRVSCLLIFYFFFFVQNNAFPPKRRELHSISSSAPGYHIEYRLNNSLMKYCVCMYFLRTKLLF